ncbi:hypothetical protein AMATHDRAFT_70077 [Amanita thiersii Skay4041]|uniref:AMP-dependent synthetase/ligase domain-containing protein n=1 Tax=Amanita thiersii Skay4041 TaxID=703135 RepID=A0A2A9NF25_9AGAR|nr:hypothetical protein AMATHDRAFT_70077 [Amanita thiersii Skay4041]
MPLSIADSLLTDDLTVLLGLIAATVFLLNNLYKPQPLVHPILLGRQSDVGRARNPGESAVYRNYGTGLIGRFPVRPNKDARILSDLIRTDVENARTLWSAKITNSQLEARVDAFGKGLLHFVGLQPRKSRVLLLLDDSLEFLIADLALSSRSIVSYTLSSILILSSVLEQHPVSTIITHATLLPRLLEFILGKPRPELLSVIVVGDTTPQASVGKFKFLLYNEVEREGLREQNIVRLTPHASDIFTISFTSVEPGELQATQLTHENITAGVVAIRALLPASNNFSPLDTVVSGHPMNTAYGRAIAYTAVYEGMSFATIENKDADNATPDDIKLESPDIGAYAKYPIPSPTILFIEPEYLGKLVSSIHQEASRSILYSVAMRHKMAGIAEGFLSKDSLWDRLVFDEARARVVGESSSTLRGVIVSGSPISSRLLNLSRTAVSIPLINAFTHAMVSGPVFATHPFDLQDFSSDSVPNSTHIGPPSVNVEVKLLGVHDEAVEAGADPKGTLLVRGPSVGKALDNPGEVTHHWDEIWTKLNVQARANTNGTFQIVGSE